MPSLQCASLLCLDGLLSLTLGLRGKCKELQVHGWSQMKTQTHVSEALGSEPLKALTREGYGATLACA